MKKLHLLFSALLLLVLSPVAAQQLKVSGHVQDSKTDEPLIGVSVVESGSSSGTVTDIDGNFTLSVPHGAIISLSYVGYESKSITVLRANLGTILLEEEAVTLTDVTVTGQMAVQRKTPIAMSTVTALEIEERIGGSEFVEVLKTTPGVHPNKQGGGWGDSEIFMRGFSSENVGVMINGCPMNDMEWGGTYWSNWQGLSDVTTAVQTQRGMGASKVSNPSVGGSINIITKSIDAKRGGFMSYALGNDGYNKIAFSVSTGLMKNGWAITVLGSKTWGNGYVQGTNFSGYSYFANISKRINDRHQLSLTAFGAPQWHYQRAATYSALTLAEWDKVKQYMTNGMHYTRYNPTYGYNDQGVQKSANYNVYHKPQISLNHVWQIDYKSALSTALYASIGRGYGHTGENGYGGSLAYNDFNGASYGVLNTKFRREDGTFDYGAIERINAKGTYGSELVMADNRNYHNWFGLVSTYNNKFAEVIDFYAGIDLRYFKGTHTAVISDLMGGDYYIDPARVNMNKDNNSNALNDAWRFKKLGVGDVCYRDYDGYVMQEGAFAQAEYNKDAWSAFVNASISYTHYWRYDRLYYDAAQARSKTVGFLGGTVKAGANYNINSHNNIFLNVGYISRAPKFNAGAFMQQATSNVINVNARNEQVASVEIGYGFHNEFVNLTLNGYFTEWMDKTMTKSGTLDNQEEFFMNMTGVNARHMGLELDLKARPANWVELSAMLSLGNWQWDSDSVCGYAYDAHGQALRPDGTITTPGADDQARATINMKGIKVGGSAQTTASLGVTFKPFKGFRIGGEYTLYDRNYAYYNFSGSNLLIGKTVNVSQPWKIPVSGSLDLRASYHFEIGKVGATLSGNVNNVLNQLYIEKAYNPNNVGASIVEATADNVYFFYTQGRTWNLRLKLSF